MDNPMEDEPLLDERKAAILRAVIESYTDDAQPVGSSAVARTEGLEVSAATIRNDMVALEKAGYLRQPHTSAGRVPTQKGYRHFVDHLDPAQVASSDRRKVAAFFGQMRGEIEEVMRETAALLADLTDYAAVVVDESDEGASVRSVQLVALADRTVMMVVVLSSGQVLKSSFDFDADIARPLSSTAHPGLCARPSRDGAWPSRCRWCSAATRRSTRWPPSSTPLWPASSMPTGSTSTAPPRWSRRSRRSNRSVRC